MLQIINISTLVALIKCELIDPLKGKWKFLHVRSMRAFLSPNIVAAYNNHKPLFSCNNMAKYDTQLFTIRLKPERNRPP